MYRRNAASVHHRRRRGAADHHRPGQSRRHPRPLFGARPDRHGAGASPVSTRSRSPTRPPINLGTSFTLEAWINPDTTDANNYVPILVKSGGYVTTYSLFLNGNRLLFGIESIRPTATSSTPITAPSRSTPGPMWPRVRRRRPATSDDHLPQRRAGGAAGLWHLHAGTDDGTPLGDRRRDAHGREWRRPLSGADRRCPPVERGAEPGADCRQHHHAAHRHRGRARAVPADGRCHRQCHHRRSRAECAHRDGDASVRLALQRGGGADRRPVRHRHLYVQPHPGDLLRHRRPVG